MGPAEPRSEEIEITELADRLRERGWRMTAQRRAIAEVLVGEHVHMTAEAIYAAAQEALPEISLATVYNTLNEMVDMGEVLEITTHNGPKRYDPNTVSAHHHLLCIRCATLRDVSPEGVENLFLGDEQRHGFHVSGFDIMFRGLCPACSAAI